MAPVYAPETASETENASANIELPSLRRAARDVPATKCASVFANACDESEGYKNIVSPLHSVINATPAAAGTNGSLSPFPNGRAATAIAKRTATPSALYEAEADIISVTHTAVTAMFGERGDDLHLIRKLPAIDTAYAVTTAKSSSLITRGPK